MIGRIGLIAAQLQSSLTDPPSSPVITPALDWVQGTLLGSVATMLAVLAIASLGFAMLSGRLEVRRGLAVLIGCFILFGAPSIAKGLMGAAQNDSNLAVGAPPPPPVYAQPQPSAAPPANAYDPYAGAAVPR
jgi:type IV secretory pathway VirB2 component (pilin)